MKEKKYKRLTIYICSTSLLFIFCIMYSINYVRNERQEKGDAKETKNTATIVSADLDSVKEYQNYITKENIYDNVKIYYPYSNSNNFNIKVDEILKTYIEMIEDSKNLENGNPWNLDVVFNVDEYNENINSFVFNIKINDGGRYPATYIETITFDFKKDKKLELKDVLKDYKSQISDVSNICYNTLINNESVANFGNFEKVKIGTAAEKLNKFSLEKNILIIYFERYQVAPYVIGELNVCIKLDDIELADI